MNVGTAGLILHVDDERSVRESLSMLLRADDYVVSSAASGTEALQLASGGLHPDVLIVDFNLGPQMNGAEVAEQIRRILSYAPPIIMLTGDVSSAKFPRITEVIVWLTCKPLNPQLLLAVLPSLIHLSRTTRKLLTRSA
jgi:CheY-like chemotaxis protein